jgi:hypothetical protein
VDARYPSLCKPRHGGGVEIRRARFFAASLLLIPVLAPLERAEAPAAASDIAADPRTCAVPASNVNVAVNENWRERFHTYGDSNAKLDDWTGGDGAYTIPLPDRRRLWFFGDTFLGKVNIPPADPNHGRPGSAPLIANSIVVEQAATKSLVRTLHGGTDAAPRAYVDAGATTPQSWYWPGAGIVEGDKVRLLLSKFHRTGPGGLDFTFDGTSVISMQLPSLTLVDDPTRLSVQNRGGVLWTNVLVQPDADYVYGAKGHDLYVAKAPAGNLLGPWTYRSGGGTWSSDPTAAAPIIGDGAGDDAQVVQVNHSFVRISMRHSTSAPLSNVIQAYFSCSPVGPWTTSGTPIYKTPEGEGDGRIVYGAYIYAETVVNGNMLATYSVNAFPDGALNYQKVHVYRPRFLKITITGLP